MVVINIQSGHGETERTKRLQGIPWAGTNLPEELLEVEGHLREMIDAGYSYRYMENFLMQHGYGVNVIRKAFTILTGIKPEEVVNWQTIRTPHNIPSVNLGWGIAKKKHDGSYFIMPISIWYTVFHQKDDVTRIEVSKYPTIMEAREALEKLVSAVSIWDPPVKPQPSKIDMSQLYKQPQLFMNATAFKNVQQQLQNIAAPEQQRRLIDQAYINGSITKDMRNCLLKMADVPDISVEDEVKHELGQEEANDIKSRPMSEIFPTSPQEYFERGIRSQDPSGNVAEAIDQVAAFLQSTNHQLKNYDIEAVDYWWHKMASINNDMVDENDIMNAQAWVAVQVKVIDKSSNTNKGGLMVFNIINDQISTDATMQGTDKRPYSLNDIGLADYFHKAQSLL